MKHERINGIFANPSLAFSFGYLASHYGMRLLTDDKVTEIMAYLEENHIILNEAIKKKRKKKNGQR